MVRLKRKSSAPLVPNFKFNSLSDPELGDSDLLVSSRLLVMGSLDSAAAS